MWSSPHTTKWGDNFRHTKTQTKHMEGALRRSLGSQAQHTHSLEDHRWSIQQHHHTHIHIIQQQNSNYTQTYCELFHQTIYKHCQARITQNKQKKIIMILNLSCDNIVDVVRLRQKENGPIIRPIIGEFRNEYDKWTVMRMKAKLRECE